jgi:hypothetical protein
MNRLTYVTLMPLLAAGLVAGCGSRDDKSGANTAGADKAAAVKPDDCSPGKGIRVGDKLVVTFAGNLAGTQPAARLHWDTSGPFVTLAKTGSPGSGKEIELVHSTLASGPSPDHGDCLRSGSYIRFASLEPEHPEPNRYLQAYMGPDGNVGADHDHVVIGNFPDPSKYSAFKVLKVSGEFDSVIERGDEVTIRGTQRDPWLVVGDNPVAGQAVGLVQHFQSDDPQPDVAKWTFGNKGSGN